MPKAWPALLCCVLPTPVRLESQITFQSACLHPSPASITVRSSLQPAPPGIYPGGRAYPARLEMSSGAVALRRALQSRQDV
jgi:hypothetical protein